MLYRMEKIAAITLITLYLLALCNQGHCQCQDRDSRCSLFGEVCKNAADRYRRMLKYSCAKTCGYCDTISCGKDKKGDQNMFKDAKIVKGNNAQPNSWIWNVLLKMTGSQQGHCGGSLIASDIVLTASTCVMASDRPSDYEIVAGEHTRSKKEGTEQTVRVQRIISYRGNGAGHGHANDITILKLVHPVELNDNVGIVCLPGRYDEPLSYSGDCWMAGWGKTEGSGSGADVLQEVRVPPVPKQECYEKNGDTKWGRGVSRYTPGQFCVGSENSKKGACRGDAGSPYVCKKNGKWVQVGLVSWGDPGCDASKRYTVLTKVNHYIPWIKEKIRDLS